MLTVMHARGPVGQLHGTAAGLAFRYSPRWLQQDGAFALSPRLPLGEAPLHGLEVAVFFANLLPEGALLDTLLRLQRLPAGNLLRQLGAFGRESAGAFSLVADEALNRFPDADALVPYPPQALAADLDRLRLQLPLLGQHAELRLSLAGAQDKIPVRIVDGRMWLTAGAAASTHILKPAIQPERLFPDAVANEAFCMRLAGQLGLPVARVEVLADPEPVLVVQRFDRVIAGGEVHRLHQLDGCQLCGVMPAQKYEADGGPGLEACFAMVDRFSQVPALDRLRLVDWVVFNYLIGNADAHAKNVSMRMGVDGQLSLAPFYDLLATGYWHELADTMAMAIGGERRPAWVHARHWQRFCETVGLNRTQLRRRALALCAQALAQAPALLDELAVGPRLAKHLQDTLQQQAGRIDQRL